MIESDTLYVPVTRLQNTRRREAHPPHLHQAGRDELLADFDDAWSRTERLFSALKDERAFLAPPDHGLRHPLIFYYGHTAVFYVNKLRLAGVIPKPLDEKFESYFAVGVDENSWDDLSKNHANWPSLAEVKSYRDRVFELVRHVIATRPEIHRPTLADPSLQKARWALLMGIEHERVHVETSSVLVRELAIEHVSRPREFPALHPSHARATGHGPRPDEVPENRWIEIPWGNAKVGKSRGWPAFGWDNEYGERNESVDAFGVLRYLISNGEFYRFVEDDGYFDQRNWSEEGWAWKTFRERNRPRFWIERSGRFYLRTLFEEIPLPWSWPVVVNFHEAKAYASWRSKREKGDFRLMSESQHHRLRQTVDPRMGRDFSYEEWFGGPQTLASPLYATANINLRHGSESPVNCDATENSRLICDVIGNVWQWCEDDFAPLKGFEPHPLYEDYSRPAFDGKHQILLGGSFMSTGEQTTPWVRTNFRRHFFQHAGIRLVRSL